LAGELAACAEANLSFGSPQAYSVNHVVNAIPVPDFKFTFSANPTTAAVPEPAGLTVTAVCLAGLALRTWRRTSA
jgi:hypothetical protein